MRILYTILLTAICIVAARAQAPAGGVNPDIPKVTARFVPDSIAIGDHFRLQIDVEQDIMQLIGFPMIDTATNMLTEHIEVLKVFPIDTVARDNRRITIRQEFLLTTFKAGDQTLFGIPVLYIDKNITDTLRANPDSLLLQVGTFEIDTLTQTIYDIKAPMRVPFKFGEVSGYLFISLAILALVAIVTFLILKFRRSVPAWARRRNDPPHVTAIRALEALHHQKLWQNNKHKLYYSLLTDIVRTYVEGRYGVQAMEMTSGELVAALRGVEMSEQSRMRLESMFSLADLAKFAKYAPEADDNETAYNDAYYFVEETKPDEVEPAQSDAK